MTKREAKKLTPTMKIKADENNELDIPFSPQQATIMSAEDVLNTAFGDKVKLNLNNKTLGDFSVFINNNSMEKLIEVLSNNDDEWKGMIVDLKKETDTKFKTDMIVIYPVKA